MNIVGRNRRVGLGPSNEAAAPRAALLIALAVLIGLLMLWKGLDTDVGLVAGPKAATDADDTQVVDASTDTVPEAADPAAATAGTDMPATPDPATVTSAAPATTAPLFPARPANEVTVLVANGSGMGGAAGAITDVLNPRGYSLESPANADRTERSGIFYRNGFAVEARMVMEVVAPGSPDLLAQMPQGGLAVPEGTLDRVANADIVVILGADGVIYSG